MLVQQRSSPWPEGASSSLILTVNLDAELGILSEANDARRRMKSLSVGTYGATCGVPRLLDIFDEFDVEATWFVPSDNVSTYPHLIESILEAGHEAGNRGLNLAKTEDPVLDLIDAQDVWKNRFGIRPSGYRIPKGQFLPEWSRLLREQGITWTSSWDGDDFPYWHPGADVVEIPWHHQLSDFGYFVFNLDPPMPTGSPRIASPDDVLDNWSWEFDGADQEGACTVVCLNPETIGTPGNSMMLRAFLSHVLNSNTWVATGSRVANRWREFAGPNDPNHPIEVYVAGRNAEAHRNG